jgi:GMP synthase (glutamine-hydrolysing)
MPKILIVDSNPAAENAAFVANRGRAAGETYAHALRQCRDDLEITIVAPYDGEDMPALAGFDGVVFTGSSVAWNTDDARAEPIAKAMRKVFDEGLPTLGSCNGMQLAASVLGGRSEASPNGHENGFAKDIQRTEAGRVHPLLQGRTDGYAVPCVHRDEVTKLPEGAVLLAGNAHSGVQAFAYEQGGIKFWGMQYHPELDPTYLGPALGKIGKLDAAQASDMALVEEDPDAVARLGLRTTDMAPRVRMTELRNWLASL